MMQDRCPLTGKCLRAGNQWRTSTHDQENHNLCGYRTHPRARRRIGSRVPGTKRRHSFRAGAVPAQWPELCGSIRYSGIRQSVPVPVWSSAKRRNRHPWLYERPVHSRTETYRVHAGSSRWFMHRVQERSGNTDVTRMPELQITSFSCLCPHS